MTDMPDPFKGADTVADLDSDHLLHLDALNLIQASATETTQPRGRSSRFTPPANAT